MGNKRKWKRKRYVVWVGRKTGVFKTWRECKAQVDGYAGAKYKSFASQQLADLAFSDGWEKHWGVVQKPKNHKRNKLKPNHNAKRHDVVCNYCGKPASFVFGDSVYPHCDDLHHKRFYQCKPCGAHVGTHPDGKPLGNLATKSLRSLRMKAHEAFDEIWKGGAMRRTQAYAWLANMLDIEPSKCHIGMFDESQCEAVIEFSLSELLDEPMLELEVESVEIAPY